MRLLKDMISGQSGKYALAVFCMAAVALSTAGLAWLMSFAVNGIFIDRNQQAIWPVAGMIFGLSLVKGLADYGQSVMMNRLGNDLVEQYQRRLFAKLLSFNVGYFERVHTSKLISRFSNHARAAKSAAILLVTSVGRDFLTLVALATVMVAQDPLLSLVALLLGPLMLLGIGRITRLIRALADKEYSGMADIIASVQETFQGIRTIKSFTLEGPAAERFLGHAGEARRRNNDIQAVSAITSPMTEALGGIAIAGAILYAGFQTVSGEASPGQFMSFMTAFLLAYEPAKRLAKVHVDLQPSLRAVSGIYEILDREGDEPANAGLSIDKPLEGHIAFKEVRFRYRREKVLRGISFEVLPGQVVALVGPSGAGKSTVASLLQRFVQAQSGAVSLDGHPIQDLDLGYLRRQIGVVSQDVTLFSGTIRENIALGRPGATEAEIQKAADAARVTEFATRMPGGLDTRLGERAVTLSGGQAQRVAIARAILKNAPILLLDEAMSALDGETERQIQQVLDDMMSRQTTIIIAHRMSTILRADKIIVLDRGKIIAEGTHGELVRSCELYRAMFGSHRPEVRARTGS